jgi:hypothetical protein
MTHRKEDVSEKNGTTLTILEATALNGNTCAAKRDLTSEVLDNMACFCYERKKGKSFQTVTTANSPPLLKVRLLR